MYRLGWLANTATPSSPPVVIEPSVLDDARRQNLADRAGFPVPTPNSDLSGRLTAGGKGIATEHGGVI